MPGKPRLVEWQSGAEMSAEAHRVRDDWALSRTAQRRGCRGSRLAAMPSWPVAATWARRPAEIEPRFAFCLGPYLSGGFELDFKVRLRHGSRHANSPLALT